MMALSDGTRAVVGDDGTSTTAMAPSSGDLHRRSPKQPPRSRPRRPSRSGGGPTPEATDQASERDHTDVSPARRSPRQSGAGRRSPRPGQEPCHRPPGRGNVAAQMSRTLRAPRELAGPSRVAANTVPRSGEKLFTERSASRSDGVAFLLDSTSPVRFTTARCWRASTLSPSRRAGADGCSPPPAVPGSGSGRMAEAGEIGLGA